MRIFIGSIGFLTVFSILSLVRGYFFIFNGIEAEFYEEPVVSPNGKYTARTFFEYYGGIAGGVNAVVEITNHTKDDTVHTIYYADAQNGSPTTLAGRKNMIQSLTYSLKISFTSPVFAMPP